MGDIIAFSNDSQLPANPDELQNLGVAAATMASSGGQADLMRLLRDGIWVFGADNVEVEEESLWAVNPYSFKHGYIAWHDSKVVGEVMTPIMQPLPPASELAEAPSGWDEQISFQLQCVEGEDEGQVCEYKVTSVGGKRASSGLATAIAAQAGADAEHVVPLVQLGVDSYQHKKYGKIYTPVFSIARWASMGDATETVEPEPEKPTGRRRRRK